ncbi:MAG: DUF1648 domain-containing protein [Nevskiales bacterium]
MRRTLSRSLFIAIMVAGLGYVAATSNVLPSLVASHFAASGEANGFMSRVNYVAFMLIFVTGFPSLVVTVMSSVYRSSRERMNLPNGDYWLAPPRLDATVEFLVAHAQWLGALLVVFICLVHRLVLQANAHFPAQLPNSILSTGIVPLMIMIALWIAVLMRRLRRPPAQQ